MVFVQHYDSPLGPITLACDETAIIGLWFDGQKYFGNILPEQLAEKEHPLLQDAKRWLDIYFSGRAPDFTPPLRYDSTPFRKAVCDIMLTVSPSSMPSSSSRSKRPDLRSCRSKYMRDS